MATLESVSIEELQLEIANLNRQLNDKDLIFNQILEGTLAGYWDWYITKDYEYMSPTFKSMFGYEDHEMPNHPDAWQKIIHPDDLPGVFDLFNKHVESKGKIPYDNEVRYFHKNGSIVWVYCRGKVIEWDDEGTPVRMVGCHVDITKNKLAQEERKKTLHLEEINKHLEQFAYITSHDLQEPIRTVNSFVKLLEEDYADLMDEPARQYLHFIRNASHRMFQQVKGLLDYSGIKEDIDPTYFNVEKALTEVLEDLNQMILESKAVINYGDMPEIKGSETHFRMLLQNLISNSIKFARSGTAPEIKIEFTDNTDAWEFAIHDNGIGIAPKHYDKIFVVFQRLHLEDQYPGTGIGLAHCKKIIELHGGKIWVESTSESGSTFYFTISK